MFHLALYLKLIGNKLHCLIVRQSVTDIETYVNHKVIDKKKLHSFCVLYAVSYRTPCVIHYQQN